MGDPPSLSGADHESVAVVPLFVTTTLRGESGVVDDVAEIVVGLPTPAKFTALTRN